MDLLDRLLGHDAWTTQQLLEHAADIPPDAWRRTFEMGPGSLQETFVHTIGATHRWADRIADRIPGEVSIVDDPSAEDLLHPAKHAAELLAEASRLIQDEGRLDEMMSVVANEKRWHFSRGSAIVHVVTHAMHHRAQIFNMMRHVGAAPSIDGDTLEWEIMGGGK